MKAPEFKIAPNDPTLAHAAAYGKIKQLREDTKRVFSRIQTLDGKGSIRQGIKLMEEHFGRLILARDVIRDTGSRPKARWLALDANVDGGSDMVAVLVEVDNFGWSVRDLLVRLSSHAVARLMQRTTKTSDMNRFAEVLRFHLLAIVPLSTSLPKGHSIITANEAGVMIWVPHEDGLRGATWIGVDVLVDRLLIKMCKDAGNDKVALNVKNEKGETVWPNAESVAGTMSMTPTTSG